MSNHKEDLESIPPPPPDTEDIPPPPPPKDEETEDSEEENESLEDMYMKLIDYKNNIFKLNALIDLEDPESDKIKQLKKMKNELKQAVSHQEESIKTSQNNDEFIYNTERLEADHQDRVNLLAN